MGEGISTWALAVSTSRKGASSWMTSPSRTWTVTISASVRPSPRSGSTNARAIPLTLALSPPPPHPPPPPGGGDKGGGGGGTCAARLGGLPGDAEHGAVGDER